MTIRTLCDARYQAIRERVEKASPGPWTHEPSKVGGQRILVGPDDHDAYGHHSEANAEFITHAREDLLYLLTKIERLEKVLNRVRNEAPDYIKTLVRDV